MADLGNRNAHMRLQCKHCSTTWPDDAVMEAVLLHYQVDHDTGQVHLDLVAVCTCGAAMTHTGSRPTGGGTKDYMVCGVCGNTGYVRRDAA